MKIINLSGVIVLMAGWIMFGAPLRAAEPDPALKGTTVINNEVSRKRDWAAGSYSVHPTQEVLLLLNTRPKDGDLLTEKPSVCEIKDDRVLWQNTAHTPPLHTWTATTVLGYRVYAKVKGEFSIEAKAGAGGGPGGGGGGTSQGAQPWWSNSLDVDIDTGGKPRDNSREDDIKEMEPGNFVLKLNTKGKVMLRSLPPQVKDKRLELNPKVVLRRSHDGVDLLDTGVSIFDKKDLASKDLADKIIDKELPLEAIGTVKGDCVFTAELTFTDPSSGYRHEFRDAIRVTIEGQPRVDIDVDWNRNGKVENDDDDPQEDAPIDFLSDTGALMLVNCDRDLAGEGLGVRDMDDNKISNAEDEKDMSPVVLDLKDDLAKDEELWLVIHNVNGGDKAWCNVMDRELQGAEDQVVAGNLKAEQRMDRTDPGNGKTWFPGGKKFRYETRFLLEGLRFAEEVSIDLEIRKGGVVTERDTVRVLNCPWLANNNTQPPADPNAWGIPGNLINSKAYPYANGGHGAQRVLMGDTGEFVQDSAEWGFQVRRQVPAADSRTMITALRLYTEREDRHPEQKGFLGAKTGVYGYLEDVDEHYFEKASGDQGGNLECLPPPLGGPFGRLVIGGAMSATLRNFLAKQKAQTQSGFVVLNLTALNLAHADEMICILNSGKVLMPDWGLAKELMAKNKARIHNVTLSDITGNTYGDILNYLADEKKGAPADKKFQKGMDLVQAQIRGAGATVIELPGMFFKSKGAMGVNSEERQRSFPRDIANSQPTIDNRQITSEPTKEGVNKDQSSIFLKEWQRLLPGIEPEDVDRAWTQAGEAHCVGNVIREPIKK